MDRKFCPVIGCKNYHGMSHEKWIEHLVKYHTLTEIVGIIPADFDYIEGDL